MNKPTPRQEHLFVIRIWEEAGPQDSASGWRGLAQHIASGQQVYFTSLRDMNDFMVLKTGQPPPREDVAGVVPSGPRSEA
ncbi:MAG: hypothetical protein GXP37_14070 [Chloroflexi bacterium]|nr:hypothetical protein [Chloroflexota bacterium]